MFSTQHLAIIGGITMGICSTIFTAEVIAKILCGKPLDRFERVITTTLLLGGLALAFLEIVRELR